MQWDPPRPHTNNNKRRIKEEIHRNCLTETDGNRDRERQRDRNQQTERERERERQTDRQTDRPTVIKRQRDRDRETYSTYFHSVLLAGRTYTV